VRQPLGQYPERDRTEGKRTGNDAKVRSIFGGNNMPMINYLAVLVPAWPVGGRRGVYGVPGQAMDGRARLDEADCGGPMANVTCRRPMIIAFVAQLVMALMLRA